MAKTATFGWSGAPALKRLLVPLADLKPMERNPRRGNIEVVAASLRRFGQTKPVVVREDDPLQLVAGHHTVLAAIELGWTHIAASAHPFADDEEARAYALADNRSADLGDYDTEDLIFHLKQLAEIDALEGTGYSTADLDEQMARLHAMQNPSDPLPKKEPGAPSDLKEVVLMYSPAQRDQLEAWLQVVAKEKGTAGVSETVYAAVEHAARTLHA